MNPKSNRGLPPQYPYRRGSTTPISSLALNSTPGTPNRSRSLDGLLDSEPKIAALEITEEASNPSDAAEESCNDFEATTIDKQTDTHTNLSKVKAHSADDILDGSVDNCELDKHSINSNSSDSKRKRNFMDRCVNKVRSLIRK